jgi:hypothetical protein
MKSKSNLRNKCFRTLFDRRIGGKLVLGNNYFHHRNSMECKLIERIEIDFVKVVRCERESEIARDEIRIDGKCNWER